MRTGCTQAPLKQSETKEQYTQIARKHKSLFACRIGPRTLDRVLLLAARIGALYASLPFLTKACCTSAGAVAAQRVGSMGEKSCTIRTRKFMSNKLLDRKQFVSSPSML